jgi:phosphoserine phosphatase
VRALDIGSRPAPLQCSDVMQREPAMRAGAVINAAWVGALALASMVALTGPAAARTGEPLPSWNAGATRTAITSFVKAVTTPGSAQFVPPADRIAVFDNDGTLWGEQPMYVQLAFVIDRVKALAPQNPQWATQEPFASILRGDLAKAAAGGEHGLAEVVAATHAGMTPEAFETIVREWLSTARHPRTGRPYTAMTYQPMLELLAYLRANGFKTYIVSGGGVEFMRAWAGRVYGVPPEQIIGSTIKMNYEVRDGVPALIRQPAIDFIDDREGKPIAIQRHIGRRPIAAFGNSDGDLQMLQWTTAGGPPRLGVLVHHTDAEREYAYDRASSVGRLDKALDQAAANRWVVIDMKRDWKVIYPPAAPR